MGVVATYTAVAVWVSTLARDRIGQRAWRRLHLLSFVTYGTAMLHGIMSGTDSGDLWTTGIYLSSAILVGGLLIARIQASAAGRAPRPGIPARSPAPSRPERGVLPPLPGRRHESDLTS